jgi:acyl-coenzyme A thioesterase PaaI-like protein
MTEVATPPNFVGGLGIELWIEGDLALGRAEVQPSFFKPGTDRVRMGVLATLVDMVAGSPAHAVINPTIDMRVSLLEHAPTSGPIELVCYPVKIGQRLFIGETLLHTGDPSRPFARSVCTFLNRPLEVDREEQKKWPANELGSPTYDEALQLRESVPGTFEMDLHEVVRNGANGTIQGGAQALMAELAGERALADLDGDHEIVDLEIRYLNKVMNGPVLATGEVIPGVVDGTYVRVPMIEPAPDGRVVALTTLLGRPAHG